MPAVWGAAMPAQAAAPTCSSTRTTSASVLLNPLAFYLLLFHEENPISPDPHGVKALFQPP